MKKFFNIFKITDLRKKIVFTGALLLVYRLGGKIPLPGISSDTLQGIIGGAGDSLLGLYRVV